VKMNDLDESFEIITDEEIELTFTENPVTKNYMKKYKDIKYNLDHKSQIIEVDFTIELMTELRHLEEKLHMWKEVRKKTISLLKDVADYLDDLHHKLDVAQVVGSGGSVLAGGLTVVGGVMTICSSGPAVPVLLAGAGVGVAVGFAGGAASLVQTVLSSKQMKDVEVAIEVDSAATRELEIDLKIIQREPFLKKATLLLFKIGGVANGAKGFVSLARGVTQEQTLVATIERVAPLLGENMNLQLSKVLLKSGGRLLSGSIASLLGGVTMIWDMYQLNLGIKKLALGGEEGVKQIRLAAEQLEGGLRDLLADDIS